MNSYYFVFGVEPPITSTFTGVAVFLLATLTSVTFEVMGSFGAFQKLAFDLDAAICLADLDNVLVEAAEANVLRSILNGAYSSPSSS